LGTELPLFNVWGNVDQGKGVIERDPANANNKVLHIAISGWGTFAPFTLPDALAGTNLCTEKDYVQFRLYRSNSDANDWKKVQIYQGSTLLYEDDGYLHQGEKGQWQQRSYTLPETSEATGTAFALGFNSDASDYYIDDVVVRGELDDYLTVGPDEQISVAKQNTSSAYETISTSFNFVEGSHLTLTTARYTYLTGKAIGAGRMDIYSGGERTYLGCSDKKSPDWSQYKGDVHVWPYTANSTSNGFYGLVWMHNGKTFNADGVLNDLADGKANSTLAHSKLTIHSGATLAAESGTRAIRIGHLELEEGSQLYGYVKNKDGNHSYYIIGGNGEDGILAGRISPMDGNTKMELGLIKEGIGTYRITGSQNQISGGIRVLRGSMLINNRVPMKSLQVYRDGTAGGTGTIEGEVNVYGILQPGDNGCGELKVKGDNVILHPSARLDFEIKSATEYDRLTLDAPITYYNIEQDFSTSYRVPRLRLQVAEDARLQVGDEFTLLTATAHQTYQDFPWSFNVIYPERYTWSVEEELDPEDFTYRVVARVTSLNYGNQNSDESDYDDAPTSSTDDGELDFTAEQQDTTPLRDYLEGRQLYVGTCVPVWSIDVDNEAEPRTALIAQQYNAVVCENEMKFDATEPNQGKFDFYHGDRLVNFAERHGMRVRGHALAWHSQVPSWLTSDGTKNSRNLSRQQLLDILKNHIVNVVGHWRGRIHEWDVANEVLSDDQQKIWSDPKSYDLRPSVWATGIGEDFLDSAFVWAHQTDPDAILILNDYGVEGKGWGKSEALFNLATRLRANGIPIHGVGLQAHMEANLDYISSIGDNVARYQQEGFLCHITELDLGMNDNSLTSQEQQGRAYYQLARMAMKYPNCAELMIWGLSDDLTWRTGKRPLLYDAQLNAKPAYWGVHAALRQAAGRELSGIEELTAEPLPSPITVDLFGRPVSTRRAGQIYVERGRKVIIR